MKARSRTPSTTTAVLQIYLNIPPAREAEIFAEAQTRGLAPQEQKMNIEKKESPTMLLIIKGPDFLSHDV
jgi:hypothetical protein